MLNLIKPFNIILACDTYKLGHWEEIPSDVENIYAVVVPRKVSPYAKEVVAMGQTFVSYIMSKIRITYDMIDEAELEVTQQGYRFNRLGWETIVKEFDGRIPLRIYGVEEGRVVKPQTPILGIINTDKRFAWLVTYFEPFIQSTMWKMSTVASLCRVMYKTFEQYMMETGSDMSMLEYKVHNFGDRGADSPDEAPVIAGMAHAALFSGSDCTRVNGYIKRLYNTPKAYTSSVEATEHTVMCLHSNAETRDDLGAASMLVERLQEAVKRSNSGIGIPIVSGVIDTYDDERFVREYLPMYKEKIAGSGGRLVARPDSGDPATKSVQVLQWLEEGFGTTLNAAGFKTLPAYIGMLYGDGMRIDTYESVLSSITKAGFSVDNFLLGMGSGITHDSARDDFSFSMKAVAAFSNGHWTRLLKEPKSDMGKKSLSGLVRCFENEDGELVVSDATEYNREYLFGTITPGWKLWFSDGYQEHRQSFDDVRARARA